MRKMIEIEHAELGKATIMASSVEVYLARDWKVVEQDTKEGLDALLVEAEKVGRPRTGQGAETSP